MYVLIGPYHLNYYEVNKTKLISKEITELPASKTYLIMTEYISIIFHVCNLFLISSETPLKSL